MRSDNRLKRVGGPQTSPIQSSSLTAQGRSALQYPHDPARSRASFKAALGLTRDGHQGDVWALVSKSHGQMESRWPSDPCCHCVGRLMLSRAWDLDWPGHGVRARIYVCVGVWVDSCIGALRQMLIGHSCHGGCRAEAFVAQAFLPRPEMCRLVSGAVRASYRANTSWRDGRGSHGPGRAEAHFELAVPPPVVEGTLSPALRALAQRAGACGGVRKLC